MTLWMVQEKIKEGTGYFLYRFRVKMLDWLIVGILWVLLMIVVKPVRERVVLIWDSPDHIQEVKLSISALSTRIDMLTPTPEISKYDKLRSLVWSPCFPGNVCEYHYYVRRTPLGDFCDAPTVIQRVLTDSTSTLHNVRPGPNATVYRVGQEWTRIAGSFIIPSDALMGAAIFHMRLRYECDFPEGQLVDAGHAIVEEESESLKLEIQPIQRGK